MITYSFKIEFISADKDIKNVFKTIKPLSKFMPICPIPDYL